VRAGQDVARLTCAEVDGSVQARHPLARWPAMKVKGEDILSDITEKTSRNLKATAAIVIAVKLFEVSVQNLEILSVKLPPNLFDVVCFRCSFT